MDLSNRDKFHNCRHEEEEHSYNESARPATPYEEGDVANTPTDVCRGADFAPDNHNRSLMTLLMREYFSGRYGDTW